MGYTKLFSELIASSIWDEDDKTRLVWITMLALKDRYHFVRGTLHYIALASRVSDDECRAAIAKLESPDPLSRSTEHEGRRIKPADGGWIVLSGERYQSMLSQEERRNYNRDKQAEYRARKKEIIHQAKCAGAQQAISEGLSDITQSQDTESPL